MKSKIVTLAVIVLLALGGWLFMRSGKQSVAPSTAAAVAESFGRKYNRPASDYRIETTKDTGSFAQGSVRIQGEMGGALWFAAKTAQGWELAADGQGPMRCDTARTYQFPRDMVPTCLDTENKNALIQR